MGNNETSGGNAKGKWILLAIVVAIAVGAYHFWLSPEVRSENYYKEGVEFVKNNKKEEAIVAFSKAIELNPKRVDAYVARAVCQTDYPDKVIADCNEAIKLEPNHVHAHITRGSAYWLKKDKKNALDDYSWAIKMDPDNVPARILRAALYKAESEFEKANADYTAVINSNMAENKDKSEAYAFRGFFYGVVQNNYISAIENFTKAIETAQGTTLAKGSEGVRNYLFRATCYINQGDYSQAVSDYTKAIELAPEDSTPYELRGGAYQLLGNTTQAEADFAKAQKLKEKK